MSKPFDASAKVLLEADPAAWAALLGVPRPPGGIEVIGSDLSAVTAAADKVLQVNDDPPWLLDVEFQSWSDPAAPRQLWKYNALLHEGHKLPVASVLVVLTPAAESSAYTGRYRVTPPFGPASEFGYTVVRVWQIPPEPLLTGPLAVVPLAPVADVPRADLPGVFARAADRLRAETPPDEFSRLLTAAGFLLKLRYGRMISEDLLRIWPNLRNESPFSVFVEEGRAEEARNMLLRMGRKKFGEPTPDTLAALTAVTDLARLEALGEKLLDVGTWDDLMRDG